MGLILMRASTCFHPMPGMALSQSLHVWPCSQRTGVISKLLHCETKESFEAPGSRCFKTESMKFVLPQGCHCIAPASSAETWTCNSIMCRGLRRPSDFLRHCFARILSQIHMRGLIWNVTVAFFGTSARTFPRNTLPQRVHRGCC